MEGLEPPRISPTASKAAAAAITPHPHKICFEGLHRRGISLCSFHRSSKTLGFEPKQCHLRRWPCFPLHYILYGYFVYPLKGSLLRNYKCAVLFAKRISLCSYEAYSNVQRGRISNILSGTSLSFILDGRDRLDV